MDVGERDTQMLPVPPEPFALIVGAAALNGSGKTLEASLRHMGLRPEPVESAVVDDDPQIAGQRFRLTFGDATVVAGHAAGAALALADPDHPSTSLLGASLPGQWREGGQCWFFVPEGPEKAAGAGALPIQMREFFKMMVLLIDLFDASHIFWSPARLWSDAAQFRASIAEMLSSGMPPVLHLVAFRRQESGEGPTVETRGLTIFTGQEMVARIPGGWTVAEMVKRLSRLALDMILNGPVPYPRTLRGLAPGEWIEMLPQPVGRGARSIVVVEFGNDG
ncbi:MAG: hypothetical protein KYX64_11890 [Sphingopyxis sp.]|nr:hypothetical protein [Sphingopyxis sp.]